jgi:regulator of protease activity HflC (stomatin/prohibitin superfamily)
MELIIILILAIVAFSVAYVVKNAQKSKVEKKGTYADEDKCPYHNEVGYETSAPAPVEVIKAKTTQAKKPTAKPTAKPSAKPSAKKPASSQKKK